jgi:hypothetical protein
MRDASTMRYRVHDRLPHIEELSGLDIDVIGVTCLGIRIHHYETDLSTIDKSQRLA